MVSGFAAAKVASMVLALVGLWFSPLAADGHSASLRIDCARLNDEHRAALEARARADLATTPDSTGEIAIECGAGTAVIGWRGGPGPLRRETLDLDVSDQARAVDGLLEAIHRLRAGAPRPATAPAAPELASVTTAVTIEGEPPHRPPGATSDRSLRPIADPAARAEKAPSPPVLEPSPTPAGRPGLGVTAASDGELWQGRIRGAVGGRVGARFTPGQTERWSAALDVGYAWGLATPENVSARALEAALRIGYAPHPRIALALGGALKHVGADLSSPGSAPLTRAAVTEALVLGVQARIPLDGALTLAIGPRVEALARPVAVELGGAEIFRVPRFVAGVSVEMEGRVFR